MARENDIAYIHEGTKAVCVVVVKEEGEITCGLFRTNSKVLWQVGVGSEIAKIFANPKFFDLFRRCTPYCP